MAIYKCKMCGGTLEIGGNETIALCGYCGTKQTLPKLNDERKANLYDRANHFRRNNEFDKAMSIYESILNEDKTDAESYWSLVLCRYGIEYVEDPASHKRIPTINRAQYTSVFMDEDYKSALEYADVVQKEIYESEAKAIDDIQKGILEISQKEEPFDVFICYKETDANGRRTPDSVLATELYHELCKEGFKVFFSRITLEDKLGTAYEPYIFAALNSAKVMVVLGTKQENFNAVWVKNEWSRFLALIKNGARKTLIPAYKDMDPYDLPEEFSHLQAQDMSKLGFMQDLVRGIRKIVGVEEKPEVIKETVVTSTSAKTNTAPLLERAFMFLEDGDWRSANSYCEKVLDLEPKNAEAYLGKLLAECRVKSKKELKNVSKAFDGSNNYQKAVRFADDSLKSELEGYIKFINERNELARIENIYTQACKKMDVAKTESGFKSAADDFSMIPDFRDSSSRRDICLEKAKERRNIYYYSTATALMQENKIKSYEVAIENFNQIVDFKDSKEQIQVCINRIEFLKAEGRRLLEEARIAEAKRIERQKQEKIKRAKKRKKIGIMIGALVAALIAFAIIWSTIIFPTIKYNKAVKTESVNKAQAAIIYAELEGYKDSKEKCLALWEEAADRQTVSAGDQHTVGLKSDGTVVTVGDNDNGQYDVDIWSDIVAVSAGYDHTVGLESDGTVVAVGDNDSGQCDVEDWTDIIAVSAGYDHTVGLKSDGTVVAVGYNDDGRCDVGGWTDIVAVSAGSWHTVGLKSDGTVVAVGYNDSGRCDVDGWTDIVAVSAGSWHTAGIKSDGTVVTVGYDYDDRCDVGGWTDIVAVSAGSLHTVGIKSDGTVVAVGSDDRGRCDVDGWTDIVAVSAGYDYIVGLKSDGTVVAVGNNDYGKCDVDGWMDIKLPDNK